MMRRFLRGGDADQSLRAQLEEAIDEHEEEGEADSGNGDLSPLERQMLRNLLHFSEHDADDVAIPRGEIIAIPKSASWQEVVDAFAEHGHSRLPVYEETIDNVVGILHAKDLLRALHHPEGKASITEFMRSPLFVPEGNKVDDLLRQMQARGNHMAIVVDEYGGMAGVVTLEDIVEEIVGEIRDEYDQSEELAFVQRSEDEYVFLGRIDIDDFNDLTGLRLTREQSDTLGGYLYARIGRIPSGGEQIRVEDWLLTVSEVTGRQIRRVRAQRQSNFDENKVEQPDGR